MERLKAVTLLHKFGVQITYGSIKRAEMLFVKFNTFSKAA
ncbi:Uncharacterised protein [Vibrio cholerae]|nr:Uncharacterised protein [Vibrio cholerae]